MLAKGKDDMPYSDWTRIISASVAPVVIISACGLLCLTFYNRMAAIVSRLRGLQRERLAEQEHINRLELQSGPELQRRRQLLEHLKDQSAKIQRRARLIQSTLFFLLSAVALLIACCLLLGISILLPQAVLPAVISFLLGLFSVLAATITAMMELKSALHPAELETRFVSEIVHQPLFQPKDPAEG